MLQYSLGPNPARLDADRAYKELFTDYPETVEWMDSLRRIKTEAARIQPSSFMDGVICP